jgi:hypothetical protein
MTVRRRRYHRPVISARSFWLSLVGAAILAAPAIAAEWSIEGRVIGICAS